MDNEMGKLVRTIPSNKAVYLLQIVIYFSIVGFLCHLVRKNGYTIEDNPDKFALWAGMWVFGAFGVVQLYSMLVTKIEIYENGILLKKTIRRVALPFNAIEGSCWGKLKYAFVTMMNFIEFRYIHNNGKTRKIRMQSGEVSKKALRLLSEEYAGQIKFDPSVIIINQRYSGN